jgi:hypothetical protein
MIDLLPDKTRRPDSARPASRVRADNDAAIKNAMQIRPSAEAGQKEGGFFRGLAIFLVISAVFWAVVIALFHFL